MSSKMPRCGLRLPGMLQSIVHVEGGAVWLADGAERWLTDGMLGRLTCRAAHAGRRVCVMGGDWPRRRAGVRRLAAGRGWEAAAERLGARAAGEPVRRCCAGREGTGGKRAGRSAAGRG